jgi:hypothetical protein
VRCGHLYALQGEHDRSNCTRCGQENDRLRF